MAFFTDKTDEPEGDPNGRYRFEMQFGPEQNLLLSAIVSVMPDSAPFVHLASTPERGMVVAVFDRPGGKLLIHATAIRGVTSIGADQNDPEYQGLAKQIRDWMAEHAPDDAVVLPLDKATGIDPDKIQARLEEIRNAHQGESDDAIVEAIKEGMREYAVPAEEETDDQN